MRRYKIDRRTALQYVGLAAAGGLAGCLNSPSEAAETDDSGEESGEDNHDDENGGHSEDGSNEVVDSATVEMVTTEHGYHFEPHVVRVVEGGTVTWVNTSGSHDSTAYHPENDRPLRIPEDAEPWSSGLLTEQDAVFEHTFDVEGVYDYYCSPHEANGMIGSIVVGEPELHGQPALQPAQESLPREVRQKIGDLNHMVEDGADPHEETDSDPHE